MKKIHNHRLLVLLLGLCLAANMGAQLNTDRILSVGRSALYFQDYVLSIQYFNQVIKAKPYLSEPYYYRAAAKINLEDYVGAENDLNTALEMNPFASNLYYARCFVRLQQDRWEEAAADIEQALTLSPETPTYLMTRLEILEHDKKYDEALRDIDFLIKKTNNIDLMLDKGRLLLMTNDTAAAVNHFESLAARDSGNVDILGARAYARLLVDDIDGAMADYSRTIAMHTSNPMNYVNRGILRYRKQDYRGALADCDKAVQMAPDYEAALFNRALIRAEVGDYNNAVKDLDRIIKNDPDAFDAIFQRATVQMRCGNNMEALADFSAVLKQYPTFIPALYGRAEAYESMGRRQMAYRDMQLAFNLTEARKKNKGKNTEEEPDTEIHVAKSDSQARARSRLFDVSAGKGNQMPNNAQTLSLRGTVQNNEVLVATQPNFQLSYYERANLVDGLVAYDDLLDAYNRVHTKRLPLKLVNGEIPLSRSLADFHFSAIDAATNKLSASPDSLLLLFERAVDYALLQDFTSSLADFSRLLLHTNDALAYFGRANVRYKQLEYNKGNPDAENKNTVYAYEYEMIIRDYDMAIKLAPSFAYAWFNRANVVAESGDYRRAISNYDEALRLAPNMAEAYFNRGLTHIYLGEVQEGIEDLSRAGEKGISEAYALLKKMR